MKKLDVLRSLFVVFLFVLCFKAVKAEAPYWLEEVFVCTENSAYVVGLAYQKGGTELANKEFDNQKKAELCGVYTGGVSIIQTKYKFFNKDMVLVLVEAQPVGHINTFWMFLFIQGRQI